jgi:hypothetical protein
VKHIIESEVFCGCGKCEEAVQDILRMEQMLCRGARSILGLRRTKIRRERRSTYDRHRYATRVSQ